MSAFCNGCLGGGGEMTDCNQAGSPPAYLFLDFDGVLHPGLSGTFCYLDRLETVLRELPHVRIVLSTSWRLESDFETELRPLFSPELRARIVGCTPDLPGQLRETEIEAWRARHAIGHHRWAALDDDASLFRVGSPGLILCDPARGLRPAQLIELRSKLG